MKSTKARIVAVALFTVALVGGALAIPPTTVTALSPLVTPTITAPTGNTEIIADPDQSFILRCRGGATAVVGNNGASEALWRCVPSEDSK